MINNIHTPSNNLPLNARRVENTERAYRNAIGDSNQSQITNIKAQNFSELKERLELVKENESGFLNKLDSKIAVALTAANDSRVSSNNTTDYAIASYKFIASI